ncbi:hypothetical protein ABPG74_012477 [Tetrahymena malaccensis]
MKNAFSKIKEFDMFGSQIHIKFQGQQSYKTKFGSVLTLIIIGIIFYRLVFILIAVYMRNNPSIIFNERQVDNPELFVATSQTFPLAFAMEDPVTRNYYVDESIYTVHAQLLQKYVVFNSTTQENNVVWNITDIPVQRCTLDNFKNAENLVYYQSLNYTNMYCFSPEIALPIQGDFPSPIFSQIQFQVKECQNNCKSPDQIKYYLMKSGFGMQLSDAYVDPKASQFPFKIYSRDMYWPTSLLMPQDVIIYIRNNYVYSDFGWVTSDIYTQKFPSYSYYESFTYPPNFQDYFLSMAFKFEKQKESEYQRKYQNIFDIISQIGGFTQTLLAIGFLLCRKLSQLQFDQEIINSVFNYYDSNEEAGEQINKFQQSNLPRQDQQNLNEDAKFQAVNNLEKSPPNYQSLREKQISKNLTFYQDNQKQLIKQKSPLQEATIISSSKSVFKQKQNLSQYEKQIENFKLQSSMKDDIKNVSKSPKNLKQQESLEKQQAIFENKFNEQFKIHTKSMRLSIWDQIKSIIFPFGKSKKKKQIINYSVEKLYYHLDIINILKKLIERLIEVEKLKRLLLDKDQIKLFDYLPKPTIQSCLVLDKQKTLVDSKRNEIDLLYQDNRTPLQKAKDAYEAYKNIQKKDEYSQLDEKIIEMIDPNLISIFEIEHQNVGQSQSLKESIKQTDTKSYQEKKKLKRKFLDNYSNEFTSRQMNSERMSQRSQSIQESQSMLDPNLIENIYSPYEQKDEIKEVFTGRQLDMRPSNNSCQDKKYDYSKMIKKIDLFGSKINLRFNGAQTYQSNIGSIITILIFGFIIARLISTLATAIKRNNPTVIFTERQVNDPALFEATSQSFPLAFAMQDPITKNYYVDESIYSVQAQLQQKFTTYNSSTQQNQTTWKYTDVPLQRCTSQNFQNPKNQQYFTAINYTNMYCLPPYAVLPIQGDFPSPVFSQIQFIFKQCQTNCKPKEVIDYFLLKSGIALYMSDAYVDPTQFEDPFQIYARNMYWPTSLQMPQDVIIFIRNNYIYSDFGWVMSDKEIQKFPSYSFYENFLYPPNFQQYFLTLTFKFEKQKENSYSRKYQDISSIISEIGGFSQSLLAIGFLVCTKVSQLQLNQQLINSVFNYEEPEVIQQNPIKKKQKVKGCCNSKLNKKQKNSNNNNNNNNQYVETSQLQRISSTQANDTKQIFIKNTDSHLKQEQNQSQFINFQTKSKTKSSQLKPRELKKSTSSSQNQTFMLASFLQEQNKIQKDEKIIKNQKISPKLIQKINKINQNSQKKKEKNFNDLLEKQTKSMQLSIWDYIKSIFFPFGDLRQKKKVIEYSINKLYNNLDILQILKRLIEVEKLKRLLLDQDQIKLFDYLPKPTIHTDLIQDSNETQNNSNRQEIDLLYWDSRTPLQKVIDAQEAYNNIQQKSKHTQLDVKIIQMVDPNLLSVFELYNTNLQINQESEGTYSKVSVNENKNQLKIQNEMRLKTEQIKPIVFQDQTQCNQEKNVFYNTQKNNCCSFQGESKENILKYQTNCHSLNSIGGKIQQNVAEEEKNNTIFYNYFNPTKKNQLSNL